VDNNTNTNYNKLMAYLAYNRLVIMIGKKYIWLWPNKKQMNNINNIYSWPMPAQ